MDIESLTALLAGFPGTLIVRGGGDVYAIHDPDESGCRPRDYPAKIIGHREARERALEAGRHAR